MKGGAAAVALSRALALELGQNPLSPIGTFIVRSKSRSGRTYEMQHTPEGYAVHQGEGCEGEIFNGPLGCWHSKQHTVLREDIEDMTSVVPYESKVPERIDFTSEQLDTIAKVICVDQNGVVAPPAFTQLFIAACRHTGLDPFLKQIYAMNLQGKWSMFVGIDGYRVISERTGLDQGMDGPQWSNDGKDWYDYPPSEGAANYCRVGVWRKGVPRPFVAVLSLASRENSKSQSWQKDPNGMLAKCCEALARRRAFPADMAVIDTDVQFTVEDPEGAPMTRAEVPEGSWRQLPEETADVPDNVDRETGEIYEGDEGFTTLMDPDDEPFHSKSLCTEEQVAAIADWSTQMRDLEDGKARLLAVDKVRRERWSYAVGDGNKFSASKLIQSHADAYIVVLKEAYEAKTPEVQQPTLVT